MQETCFSGTSLTLPKSPAKNTSSQRSSRDLDEHITENEHDRCSIASYGSGNTTDSDNKVFMKILLNSQMDIDSVTFINIAYFYNATLILIVNAF